MTGKVDDLSVDQMQTLLDWEEKFKAKYTVVGQLVPLRELSLTELAQHDGTDASKPMYMSVQAS